MAQWVKCSAQSHRFNTRRGSEPLKSQGSECEMESGHRRFLETHRPANLVPTTANNRDPGIKRMT